MFFGKEECRSDILFLQVIYKELIILFLQLLENDYWGNLIFNLCEKIAQKKQKKSTPNFSLNPNVLLTEKALGIELVLKRLMEKQGVLPFPKL